MQNIKNDGLISIVTGKSRKSTSWRNKEIKWSDMIRKLSIRVSTQETESEYKNMSKEQRDSIKDKGGFVGGKLKENGRRTKESIESRSLVTLDIDYGSEDMWETISEVFEYACCMYSTHSHRKDNPRYRLIIPLSRAVTPEEYQAISRMIASEINIELFDDTTYEPSRLMYWPSTPKDGVYEFNYKDREWINPDDVLNKYVLGWQDVSYWPHSSRVNAHVTNAIKKQEDPLEKSGVIGTFCRSYSITEAIETFLSDVYRLSDDNQRATYINGSTSNGVLLYDDKFSYSYHNTDPTSYILCNAFDLVRIHKFGNLDENVRGNTKPDNIPSFKEMLCFIRKDAKFIQTENAERLEKIKEDFDLIDEVIEVDTEWEKQLTRNESGAIERVPRNVRLIIENDAFLKSRYMYDEFSQRHWIKKRLPWDKSFIQERAWEDSDDAGLREYIYSSYSVLVSREKYDDAITLAFKNNSVHPVREYIKSTVWDGVPRVETIFIDYLGAEDNQYNRMVAKKALVAAVKRVFMPGSIYEEMPILYSGRQGVGKSTLLRKLGKEWYNANLSFNDIKGDTRKAVEQTEGSWLIELGELKGLSSKDADQIKSFMSGLEDKTRKAYARRTSITKRQFIIIGTTNNQEFLSDRTGNRRFLPIYTDVVEPKKDVFDDKSLDKIHIKDEVDLIWAEAYHYYEEGYETYLNEQEKELAKEQQEMFTYSYDEDAAFIEYLEKPIKKINERNKDWYSLDLSERRYFLYPEKDFESDLEPSNDDAETEIRDKICAEVIYDEFLSAKYPFKYLGLTRDTEIEIKNMLVRAGWRKYPKSRGRMKFGVYGLKTAYIKG